MWIDYTVIYMGDLRGTVRRLAADKAAWVCPVCGSTDASVPPWANSAMITGVADPAEIQKVSPSEDFCSCCEVFFGQDDLRVRFDSTRTLDEKWHWLRIKWLERVGWDDEAITQLANLDRSREEVLLWKQNAASNG